MSRIGKKPIKIEKEISVSEKDGKIFVKGPKGELSLDIPSEIDVKISEEEIIVSKKIENKKSKALWGTIRALIANMIEGVSKGYTRELQVKGVGYRAEVQGNKLILKVGFSHPVEVEKVEGIEFAVAKDIISVTGIKKELVGRVASEIRMIRPPEPYKGKGIRYKDEVIAMKEGKKSVGK